MRDPIQLEKTEFYQRTDCSITPIGPCLIVTARGTIVVQEVPGFLTIDVSRNGAPASVAVMVYSPSPVDGEYGDGLIVQMDAKSARSAGYSLVALAETLEPGGAN